jgi:hypothetical protein
MYETRRERLLAPAGFLRRLLSHLAVAFGLIAASVAIGMWGYGHFERLSPLDAFLETAMLLGGMGPLHAPTTEGGKLFAGLFALYAGLAFIAVVALVLGPVLHRVLHRFHLDRD